VAEKYFKKPDPEMGRKVNFFNKKEVVDEVLWPVLQPSAGVPEMPVPEILFRGGRYSAAAA
jgi:hypothetical protein